jgi:hypothetical protein
MFVFVILGMGISVFVVSAIIVAFDPAHHRLLRKAAPVARATLIAAACFLALSWLHHTGYDPLDSLGTKLLSRADHAPPGSLVSSLGAWLLAPAAGLAGIVITLVIIAASAVGGFYAVSQVVKTWPTLRRIVYYAYVRASQSIRTVLRRPR